ncbi:hypothetical protein CP960_11950 [Malaciobacter halophilus]|uniref:VWFA domain-containing protein n=1 Tax=Malaciobacter halophilus TaxID=197482 RepID=A0A2N1J037_9BACT|nr:VWA domain-containing protein [Malaciobacter halophilus]AXH10392.1 von Willebrand factor type A (vWA) domain-containing protein [Malaciobacter halophilus]PKI79928.1 hypothetical protein CP960_11950 [Malaciobacter halophilus]
MQFLYPNVLFFMLIPTILLAFFITTNKKSIEKFFTKEAINKLTVNTKFMNQNTRNILLFIAVILMLIALGRPVIEPKEQKIKQELISYTIALDVSKSMLANDIKPNRLTLAKNKLLTLLNLSKDKAVSIILFSNSSFILSPLTKDIDSLKQIVSRIDEKYTFDNGSNLQVAIKSATKLLKTVPTKNLVILTDGTDKNSFEEEINLANESNLNIYTISTATKQRTPIKLNNDEFLSDENGNIVTVALNENIKKLSLSTGGAYINYTIDNYDVNSIMKTIEKNSTKQNSSSKKFKVYTELFYYPLGLALIILLIAFSSLPKKSRYLPFILLLILPYDIKASITDFKTITKAQDAYEKKDYKIAEKEFKKVAKTPQAYYNLANSLYKQNKFKQALENYRKVVTSDDNLEFKKLHNMGNSYTKLNKLEDALRSYEKALKIKQDKQTKQNLEIVKEALNKQKKQDSKNSDNKNSKNNDNEKNNKQNSKQNQSAKNKKDEKNTSLKNSKNKEKKESKEKKKNKENKEIKNEQKNAKNNIKNKEKKSQISKINENEISNREEKKWLRQLEKKEIEIFLKKDEQAKEKTKW